MTKLGLSRKASSILVTGFLVLFLTTFLLIFIPKNVDGVELFRISLSNGPLLAISVASYAFVMQRINQADTDPPIADLGAAKLTLRIIWALLGVQFLILALTVIDPPLADFDQLQTASSALATVFGGFLAIIRDTLFPSPEVVPDSPKSGPATLASAEAEKMKNETQGN